MLVAVSIGGCGSSEGSPGEGSASGSPASTEPDGAVSDEASGDCPLTVSEVSAAIGQEVSELDPAIRPESWICEFSTASEHDLETDANAHYENPTVEVSEFPLPDQEQKTPAALKAKLEELEQSEPASSEEIEAAVGTLIDQPSWGQGAFLELTQVSANDITPVNFSNAELWFPHQKISVLLPEGSVPDPQAVAEQIGSAAAKRENPSTQATSNSETDSTAQQEQSENLSGSPSAIPKPCSILTEEQVEGVFPNPIPVTSSAEDCNYTNEDDNRLGPKELTSIDFAITTSEQTPTIERVFDAWEKEEAHPQPGHETYVERDPGIGDGAICHYDHYRTVHQTTVGVQRGDVFFMLQLESFNDSGACPPLFELAAEVNSRLS